MVKPFPARTREKVAALSVAGGLGEGRDTLAAHPQFVAWQNATGETRVR
jgi:hypothetical protein